MPSPRTIADRLRPDEGHVWIVDIGQPIWDLHTVLTEDEQARAQRFHRPEDRILWTRARAATRWTIRQYVAPRQPQPRLAATPDGKPFLDPPIVQISLSHAQARLAIALTLTTPVGVDIERDLAFPNALLVAGQFFHPAEAADLAALPCAIQSRAFLAAWTLKEAALKASGSGLRAPLASIRGPILLAPRRNVSLITRKTGAWPRPPSQARSFGANGYIGAVAGRVQRWRIFRLISPPGPADQANEAAKGVG